MIFYDKYRNMLSVKCDICGKKEELYRGETDKCLAHDWIHENGWKTMKNKGNKWIQLCDECKKAFQDQKRNSWLRGEVEA